MSKIGLITGAGSGVGRAAAMALAADGWSLALAGRRASALEETIDLCGEGSRERLIAITADVSVAEEVDALMAATVDAFAHLDMAFNNAGTFTPAKPFDEITFAEWKNVIDVNVNGAFLVARAAYGQMKRQDPRGGRIINNGSISAHVPRLYAAAYTTSKHAITGLTRSIALDGRHDGIVCGQIDIGNAATPMTEKMPQGVYQADGSKRAEAVMDVAHVGSAVAYMANLPLDANVQFMTIMAPQMPYIGRG